MSSVVCADADVVVIGFGLTGAAAAQAAVEAGARVHVIDHPLSAGRAASRERSARSRARSAAVAAGARVLTPAMAHEVLIEGDRAVGIGYSELPAHSVAAFSHRCLDWMGAHAIGTTVADVAEVFWQGRARTGAVRAASIVLAVDPSQWEFAGAAVWALLCAGRVRRGPRGTGGTRSTSTGARDRTSVELSVRQWCADQEGVACSPAELGVDPATGALIGEGRPLPGLFSASARPGDQRESLRPAEFGRRVGRAAAVSSRSARAVLRSVG